MQTSNQNNWLRTQFIQRRDVQRVYVELKFTVRDCNSLPNIPGSCKETFNLFYYESDTDSASENSPSWMETPYIKVDTIAPDESFSRRDSGRVNTKVRSFGPLSRAGFYLAFQDLGACVSLISVRVFFKKCQQTIAGFASFPETLTGAEATSLVIAPGACVPNALEVSVPLKLYCNGDGEWMVPVGSCTCAAGYEAAAKDTQCLGNLSEHEFNSVMVFSLPFQRPSRYYNCILLRSISILFGFNVPFYLPACNSGTYKAKQGEGPCIPCPAYSQATSTAATICSCQKGYYRADGETPEKPCTCK